MASTALSPQEFIRYALAPRILVCSTEDCQAAFRRSGMTLADALRPFGTISGFDVAKVLPGRAKPFQDFPVHFIEPLDLEPVSAAVMNKVLNDVSLRAQLAYQAYINSNSSTAGTATPGNSHLPILFEQAHLQGYVPAFLQVASKDDVPKVLEVGLMRPLTPWYEAYRDAIVRLLRPSNHEFVYHPVSCVVAVSTAAPDPLAACRAAFDPAHPPQVFQANQMDVNLPRIYLLVHDVGNPPPKVDPEAVLTSLRAAFGPSNVYFMSINSRPIVSPIEAPSQAMNKKDAFPVQDIWSSLIFETMPSGAVAASSLQSTPQQSLSSSMASLEPLSRSSLDLSSSGSSSVASGANVPYDPLTASMASDLSMSSSTMSLHSAASLSASSTSLFGPSGPGMAAIGGGSNLPPAVGSTQNTYYNPPAATLPGGQRGFYFSTDDVLALRSFANDLVLRTAIPHMERVVQVINETVNANKSGIRKSVVTAAKRWFGGGDTTTSKPGSAPASASSSPSKAGSPAVRGGAPGYGAVAGAGGGANPAGGTAIGGVALQTISNSLVGIPNEVLQRRAADLSFMLQDYDFAGNTFHTLKKEFNNDKAFKYYAGAQEMTGVSYFMSDAVKKEYDHYFESAITTYLTRCKWPTFATRTTILATEVFKAKGLFREAASAFIRMTGDDSDLRSGLFLEQAGHCFLRMPQSMFRKYAFHLVLAGHRFTKCNQRQHALRCYMTALQVYRDRDWGAAEDHVHFTLGRQAYYLGLLEDSLVSFFKLVSNGDTLNHQQSSYLREFLYIYKQYASKKEAGGDDLLPTLPVPHVNQSQVKVVLDDTSTQLASKLTKEEWAGMEKGLISSGIASAPSATSTAASVMPNAMAAAAALASVKAEGKARTVCVVGEPVKIEFELVNPLQIPLQLLGVSLRCLYSAAAPPLDPEIDGVSQLERERSAALLSNNPPPPDRETLGGSDAPAKGPQQPMFQVETLEKLDLAPGERRLIRLSVTPSREGFIRVRGIVFSLLGASFKGRRDFVLRGKRLFGTQKHKVEAHYAGDNRLTLEVAGPMPKLSVKLSNLPETMYCGEVVRTSLEISNTGNFPMRSLRVKTSHPEFFSFFTKSLDPTTSVVSSTGNKHNSSSNSSSNGNSNNSNSNNNTSGPRERLGSASSSAASIYKPLVGHRHSPSLSSSSSLSSETSALDASKSTLLDGTNQVLGVALLGPSSDTPVQSGLVNASCFTDPSIAVIDLGEKGVLAPGATLSIPVFFHAEEFGDHVFSMLFYYEADRSSAGAAATAFAPAGKSKLNHRFQRYTVNAKVIESLRISAFSRPSAYAVNEHIVALEVKNMHHNHEFTLQQISAVSGNWKLVPLSYTQPEAFFAKIAPTEIVSMYFRAVEVPPAELEHATRSMVAAALPLQVQRLQQPSQQQQQQQQQQQRPSLSLSQPPAPKPYPMVVSSMATSQFKVIDASAAPALTLMLSAAQMAALRAEESAASTAWLYSNTSSNGVPQSGGLTPFITPSTPSTPPLVTATATASSASSDSMLSMTLSSSSPGSLSTGSIAPSDLLATAAASRQPEFSALSVLGKDRLGLAVFFNGLQKPAQGQLHSFDVNLALKSTSASSPAAGAAALSTPLVQGFSTVGSSTNSPVAASPSPSLLSHSRNNSGVFSGGFIPADQLQQQQHLQNLLHLPGSSTLGLASTGSGPSLSLDAGMHTPTGSIALGSADPFAAIAASSQSIQYVLRFREPLVHSFSSSKLCRISGEIFIFNRSPSSYSALLDLSPPSVLAGTNNIPSTSRFQWCGIAQRCFSIGPKELKTFPLEACCLQPGVLDLHRLKLLVKQHASGSGASAHALTPVVVSSSVSNFTPAALSLNFPSTPAAFEDEGGVLVSQPGYSCLIFVADAVSHSGTVLSPAPMATSTSATSLRA